jgi:hypothetical protein
MREEGRARARRLPGREKRCLTQEANGAAQSTTGAESDCPGTAGRRCGGESGRPCSNPALCQPVAIAGRSG